MGFLSSILKRKYYKDYMSDMWGESTSHKFKQSAPPREKRDYACMSVFSDISTEVVPNYYYGEYLSKNNNAKIASDPIFVKSRYMPYASCHAYRTLDAEMQEYKMIQSSFKGNYTCKDEAEE